MTKHLHLDLISPHTFIISSCLISSPLIMCWFISSSRGVSYHLHEPHLARSRFTSCFLVTSDANPIHLISPCSVSFHLLSFNLALSRFISWYFVPSSLFSSCLALSHFVLSHLGKFKRMPDSPFLKVSFSISRAPVITSNLISYIIFKKIKIKYSS